MKTSVSENHELSLLTIQEMNDLNGGFISYLSVGGAIKWVLGEATDFIDGFNAGYNAATEYQLMSK